MNSVGAAYNWVHFIVRKITVSLQKLQISSNTK